MNTGLREESGTVPPLSEPPVVMGSGLMPAACPGMTEGGLSPRSRRERDLACRQEFGKGVGGQVVELVPPHLHHGIEPPKVLVRVARMAHHHGPRAEITEGALEGRPDGRRLERAEARKTLIHPESGPPGRPPEARRKGADLDGFRRRDAPARDGREPV